MKDITGLKYGKLTVLEKTVQKSNREYLWKCLCECGNIHFALKGNLERGMVRSCGCLYKEMVCKRGLKHGQSTNRTLVYRRWQSMKDRCENPNQKYYLNYGGRGIKVCDNWLGKNGFINFFNEMGNPPTSEHTLDRINVNDGYYAENCRWATRMEQSNNMRTNRRYEYNGVIDTIANLSRKYNINANTIIGRIKRGWSIKKAIEEPIKKYCINRRAKNAGEINYASQKKD
jgi:hypothetical protein